MSKNNKPRLRETNFIQTCAKKIACCFVSPVIAMLILPALAICSGISFNLLSSSGSFLGFSFIDSAYAAPSAADKAAAKTKTGSLDVSATIQDALRLELSSTLLSIDLTPSASGRFASGGVNLTASTTNSTGYILYVTSSGLDNTDAYTTNLVHGDSSINDVISSLSSSVTLSTTDGGTTYDGSSFSSNKWGFSTNNSAYATANPSSPTSTTANSGNTYNGSGILTSTSFRPIPANNTTSTIATSDGSIESDSTTVTIGSKVDTEIVSGTYSNKLTFTLLANAVPYTYTANYNANTNGDGTSSDSSAIVPEATVQVVNDERSYDLTLSDTVPTRNGYSFVSWNTEANGSGTSYDPGDTISLDYENPTITLYAQWSAIDYTIAGNGSASDGGSITGLTISTTSNNPGGSNVFNIGDTVTVSASNIPSGYSFDYWSGTYDDGLAVRYFNSKNSSGNSSSSSSESSNGNNNHNNKSDYDKKDNSNRSFLEKLFFGENVSAVSQSITFADSSSNPTTFTMPAGNVSITAHLKPNQYTLTVNPNGGTWNGSTSDQTFTQDYNTTKTLDDPTSTPSYTISYDANNTGIDVSGKTPTSITRSFSSWSLTSGYGTLVGSTFTYGAGDSTITANYNTTSDSFTLPNISKTGYTCKWAEGSASGTEYYGNTSRTVTGNTTYYAKCTINSYAVTVNKDGNISSVTGADTYNYGTTVNISATPSTGYHFKNWTTSSSGVTFADSTSSSTTFSMPDNAVTVQANSEANTYTIKYNANSGTGSVSDGSGTYGGNATLAANGFSRTGYTFMGWNIGTSGSSTSATYSASTAYAVSTLASAAGVTNTNGGTINLYAVWKPYWNYSLSYDANGGNANSVPSTQTSNTDYSNTHTFTIPNTTPTRSNHTNGTYTFTSWNTVSGGTGTSKAKGANITLPLSGTATAGTPTVSQTLYAQWSKVYNYTLNYAAGSAGTSVSNMPSQQTTSSTGNGTFTISNTVPTWTGHTFSKWNDGSSNYNSGASYTITKSDTSGATTKTLTAQWTTNTYTVSISGSNATYSSTSLSVPYGSYASVTVTPSTGYYISSGTCTNTANYTIKSNSGGTASYGTSYTSATTYRIYNNSKTSTGSCSFTMTKRSFTVTISTSGSGLTAGANSISVQYGSSNTVTITPSSGYKISAASCTNSYAFSPAANNQTSATTFTITNPSSTSTSTCTFTGAKSGPSYGETKTVNGVQYIYLKDNKWWTKNSQGSTIWANASSLCPSGSHLPSAQEFDSLLTAYGGSANTNSNYGSPYGWYDGDGDLYNATGWSGSYWSSTEYASNISYVWFLYVQSSFSFVAYNSSKMSSYVNVVCIGS